MHPKTKQGGFYLETPDGVSDDESGYSQKHIWRRSMIEGYLVRFVELSATIDTCKVHAS